MSIPNLYHSKFRKNRFFPVLFFATYEVISISYTKGVPFLTTGTELMGIGLQLHDLVREAGESVTSSYSIYPLMSGRAL